MELTHTLSANDREILSRAMDMAARYFPRSRISDQCFVISRGLAPDTLDRDHAYLSALVNLAHHGSPPKSTCGSTLRSLELSTHGPTP